MGSAERADARADHDVALKKQTRVSGLQLVKAEPGQTVGEAVLELEGDSRVAYAEPNTIVRAASTPNDPLYSTLWGLEKIKAPGAWDATTGSSGVTVAVTDTGVAYDHPDLANRMWQNAAEAGGTDGVDDDGNGYVDDVRGWDTIDGDSDPRDLEEHGTHVAGTIGAQGNNALGITGVAQDTRIMPIRVLKPQVGGTAAALVEGFDYAGDMGADIVNASLSGQGTVQSVQDVVEAHPDTLYVSAAGNDNTNVDGGATRWPCNVTAPNMICVAATDQSDNRASFSNYGATSVDLGAPGTNVRSTVSSSDELAGSRDSFEADDFLTRWVADPTWARTTERDAGGSWSMTDSPGANYQNDTNASVRTAAPYDLTGKQGCYVHYDMRLRTETNFDTLKVETSPTGTSDWTTRKEWSGVLAAGDFASYSTYLFSDGGQPYVRFRLTTDDAGINDDGVHLDNVRVLCKGSNYDSSHYKYFQGTSMATPHVSGTAALVLSLRPTATVSELRAALLESGDTVSSLAGKTVTGKRLNALGAVGHGGPLGVTGDASDIGGTGARLECRGQPDRHGHQLPLRVRHEHRLRQRDHVEERRLRHHTSRGERHRHGAAAEHRVPLPRGGHAWRPHRDRRRRDVRHCGRAGPAAAGPGPRRRGRGALRRARLGQHADRDGLRGVQADAGGRHLSGHPGRHGGLQRAHHHRPHRGGRGLLPGAGRELRRPRAGVGGAVHHAGGAAARLDRDAHRHRRRAVGRPRLGQRHRGHRLPGASAHLARRLSGLPPGRHGRRATSATRA